ncbi:hypothetical protein GS538_09635, partial [Rhodococcus hoagii]|nr:hypothetical protein [Prescottella equi]
MLDHPVVENVHVERLSLRRFAVLGFAAAVALALSGGDGLDLGRCLYRRRRRLKLLFQLVEPLHGAIGGVLDP